MTARNAIGKKEIGEARETLTRFRSALAPLRRRMRENELWWQMKSLPMSRGFARETDDASGWLFNCVTSKHADAMDNYPGLSVLPREPGDEEAAEILSRILPVILEENGFEEVYDRCWLDKLKNGTACYGVFWNAGKRGGLGDVDIRAVDLENLYWEPGVQTLEESRSLFYVSLEDRDDLRALWPDLPEGFDAEADAWLTDRDGDTKGTCAVIDWYYRRREGERSVVHLCKFCGSHILFSSENDPAYAGGIYRHGQYPFILDCLYPVKGSPAGLGLIDRMKGVQRRIDMLQNAITENALECVNNRWFIRDSAGINEAEFCDHSNKLVHVSGDVDDSSVKAIRPDAMNGNCLHVLESMINEMKEVSGNRDASSGGSGGVTAASAIAAMQEAGSKLSRDMVRAGYRAFSRLCCMVIEDIRQFYTGERVFRVTGDGGTGFLRLRGRFFDSLSGREPVYDIRVRPLKEGPYTRLSRNELAVRLYNMGLFSPERTEEALMCLEMMDFDGRAEVMSRLRGRGERNTAPAAPETPDAPMPVNPAERADRERERVRGLREVTP